jgi:hypothetical protein
MRVGAFMAAFCGFAATGATKKGRSERSAL